MKQINIKMLDEEIKALLDFKKVSIYENEDTIVNIRLPDTKENRQRANILARYDNEEYYEDEVLK